MRAPLIVGDLLTGKCARGVVEDVAQLRKAAGSLSSAQVATLWAQIRAGLKEFAQAVGWKWTDAKSARYGVVDVPDVFPVCPELSDADFMMRFLEVVKVQPVEAARFELATTVNRDNLCELFAALGLMEARIGLRDEVGRSAFHAAKFLQERPKEYQIQAGQESAKRRKEKTALLRRRTDKEFWRLCREFGWNEGGTKKDLIDSFMRQAKITPKAFLDDEVLNYVLSRRNKTIGRAIDFPTDRK
ncbi:MAG: hypothetical protein IPH26_06805 [Sterolibacteriaceae bacterium]|uniref:SAP domain-containing protein n=1 Tax=Candidatus Methylophosphatis roskildensis TaxID=2899263 RepID=A0A9D7E7Q8_9PROT|nr:hypothetical protein [Candidatus Methylophosphatis roskildensis]MBK7235819.1 hypothetical protein [Sterolibacteriaceae bacterium]